MTVSNFLECPYFIICNNLIALVTRSIMNTSYMYCVHINNLSDLACRFVINYMNERERRGRERGER